MSGPLLQAVEAFSDPSELHAAGSVPILRRLLCDFSLFFISFLNFYGLGMAVWARQLGVGLGAVQTFPATCK